MKHRLGAKWQARLRDPMWQFGGVVAAMIALVAGILVTYDVYQRTQRGAELTLAIESKYADLWFSSRRSSDLEVYYLGKKAANVSSLRFRLENTGHSPILPEHFIQPLGIAIHSTGEVVDVRVVGRQPDSVDASIASVVSNTIQLANTLWNPGDSVSFQVTIVNESNPSTVYEINSTGRIVGVSRVMVTRDDQPTPTFWLTEVYLGFTLVELVIAAVITLTVFGASIRFLRQRRPDIWASKHLEFHLLALAAGAAITVFWTEQVVYEVFVRGRGSSLMVTYKVFLIGGALLIAIFLAYALLFVRRPPRSKPES